MGTSLGSYQVIGADEFSIVVLVEGESAPRYLDREDYPELATECQYEKTVADKIKESYMASNKNEITVINIYDCFDIRDISVTERRTKLEDYLITFESLNGMSWVDDVTIEGTATLVTKNEKGYGRPLDGVVATIEQMYGGGE